MQIYQSVQMNECTWGRQVQKLKCVGSWKQQIPSFPEPLCVGHLLTPGLLCNGQVQWAKAMANIGRARPALDPLGQSLDAWDAPCARANGDLGATKEAPHPGNPTIGRQLDWEHDAENI